MLEVHGHPAVPVVLGNLQRRMPLVVGCVVDQEVDRTERLADRLDGRFQRRDVGQVAGDEKRPLPQLGVQFRAAICVDIEEADKGSLSVERANDSFANAAGPAGHDDDLVLQV